MPGIYGSEQTESEGVAINPWPSVLYSLYIPPDWSFVVIIVNKSLHVQVFTVTSILFTVTAK